MKRNKLRKMTAFFTFLLLVLSILITGCGNKKEEILICTSIEDYVVEDLTARLAEEFPEYEITIEYLSTGNHAAKLLAEGTATDCDITYDLEYAYLYQLAEKNILADLSGYDMGVYCDDIVESNYYIPHLRSGGAIILNTEVMQKNGLAEPTCYADLLKPEYKNLISMPNPKSSGTGYMFLKSLVNAWGEEEALSYFEELTPNVLQYTSSGSGPVNALCQGEVAIGFGMTSQAVIQLNNGSPLKVVFFEEGSPYTLYGQGIIAGKEDRACVKEVFDFLIHTYGYEYNEKFGPEKLFKDIDCTLENYPQKIQYADMSSNTISEKERLLEKWVY